MLLLPLALVAGVAAGRLLGGTLWRLAALHIRAPALVVAAAGCQASLPIVPGPARFPAVALSYALAGAWLVVNVTGRSRHLRLAGSLIALGWLLNTAVIGANGGMPVSLPALASAGGDTSVAGVEGTGIRKHVAGTAGRHLTPLGDVIALPAFGVVSAGDLVLAVGLTTAVAAAMCPGGSRTARVTEPCPITIT